MSTFTDLDLGSSPNDGTGTTLRAGGAIINANNALAANLTEDAAFLAFFGLGTPESVTIASGVATITKSYIIVNGQGGGADDLDTITGGAVDGNLLIIKKLAASGTVTVTESGNINLGAATRDLTPQVTRLILQYDAIASKWVEISFSSN